MKARSIRAGSNPARSRGAVNSHVKNQKNLSSMMERLNNEINIFADTIGSTQRAGD